MSQRINLTISGIDLPVITDESSKYMHELAEMVDEKIYNLQATSPKLSLINASMYASLDFCDTIKKANGKFNDYETKLRLYKEEIQKQKNINEELKQRLDSLKGIGR